MLRYKQRLPKVAGDDFFRLADCGQIDPDVPTQQYIDVYRYTLQLRRGKAALEGAIRRFGAMVKKGSE
jgi:hypothetical protein